MPQDLLTCVKCNGQLERGFVVDRSHAQVFVAQWAAGEPHPSFWTNTKLPTDTIAIGTFRCSTCGYLEYYARPEFEQQK